MKKYILFDHDGVLVNTEFWYYKAGERALADIGLTLDKNQYLRDMNQGLGTWAQARAAGIDEHQLAGLGQDLPGTVRLDGSGCAAGPERPPERLRGAGEGNRTLMTSLEGWGSAIELRPRSGEPPWCSVPALRA